MLQFGESTIRLAVIARQSGHGAEAVNELWPLVSRLKSRAADGHVERNVMLLLARVRAELGVSLGYILSEERLVSAACPACSHAHVGRWQRVGFGRRWSRPRRTPSLVTRDTRS